MKQNYQCLVWFERAVRLFLWFAGLFRLGLFLSWMFPFSFFLLDGNAFLTCKVHICLILCEVIVLKQSVTFVVLIRFSPNLRTSFIFVAQLTPGNAKYSVKIAMHMTSLINCLKVLIKCRAVATEILKSSRTNVYTDLLLNCFVSEFGRSVC